MKERFRPSPEGNGSFRQFAGEADEFAVETEPFDYEAAAEAIINDAKAIMAAREAVDLAYADDGTNGYVEVQKMEGPTEDELTETELEFSREEILADEELRLGSAMTNHMKFIKSIPMLTEAEEKRLGELAMAGDRKSRHGLVVANLRYAVYLATKYRRKYERSGLTIDDLTQEATIGLIRAADRFDPSRARFTTYATWWINQGLGRSLAEQGNLVRIPMHAIETLSKIGNLNRELKKSKGRMATIQEMAAVTGKTEENIKELLRAAQQPISLDRPIGYGANESDVKDLIEDPIFEKPEQGAVRTQLADMVGKAINTLAEYDKRAPDIIRYRYGLAGEGGRTLQEVADMYHVSRERVRQIEMLALRRLRKLFNKEGDKQVLRDIGEIDG